MDGHRNLWVTGEFGVVPPLEDLGPGLLRHKESVRWSNYPGQGLSVGPPVPEPQPSMWWLQPNRRNEVCSLAQLSGAVWPAKAWGLVLRFWDDRWFWSYNALESGVRVQPFSGGPVGQVFVVGPYNEWLLCSLQPMSPLLEIQHHCQEFPVFYIIVSLCRGEMTGEIGTGVLGCGPWESARRGLPLPQYQRHPPPPHLQLGVGVHQQGPIPVFREQRCRTNFWRTV